MDGGDEAGRGGEGEDESGDEAMGPESPCFDIEGGGNGGVGKARDSGEGGGGGDGFEEAADVVGCYWWRGGDEGFDEPFKKEKGTAGGGAGEDGVEFGGEGVDGVGGERRIVDLGCYGGCVWWRGRSGCFLVGLIFVCQIDNNGCCVVFFGRCHDVYAQFEMRKGKNTNTNVGSRKVELLGTP